jgi:hypothetical protein
MLHSWRGYEKYAWGNDELCPVTLKGKNGFGGLGATMIDALDTLHMMGELQLLCCGWGPRRYCLATIIDGSCVDVEYAAYA